MLKLNFKGFNYFPNLLQFLCEKQKAIFDLATDLLFKVTASIFVSTDGSWKIFSV